MLARRGHIGIETSSYIPYFEFKIYIDLLLKDLENETELIK